MVETSDSGGVILVIDKDAYLLRENTSVKFKHNKKRNTAFLFEALIKEMAKAVVDNNEERQGKIARIIKRHFQKRGVLYKDLQNLHYI